MRKWTPVPGRGVRGVWIRALGLALAVAAGSAGCGDEPVEPLPRSTLSAAVPKISELSLLNALPKPADFGPEWTFDTDSTGHDDYFFTFANGVYARNCKHADPSRINLPSNASEHVITGRFRASALDKVVSVTITVDAPAEQADRIAFVRRAFDKCQELTVRDGGDDAAYHSTVTTLEVTRAGQAFHIRVKYEKGEEKAELNLTYARAGALVAVIEGAPDVSAVMPAVIARAADALPATQTS